MSNFLSETEKKISSNFEKKGYVILNVDDIPSLNKIRSTIVKSLKKQKVLNKLSDHNYIFNSFHKIVDKKDLNLVRKNLIFDLNSDKNFRKIYYNLSKKYLDILLGNELAMQRRANLSIQLPNDRSSLLPVHSDVWGGNSPFDLVVWMPLVDCYKTKSMYLLPPNKILKYKKYLSFSKKNTGDSIYNKIKKDLIWINIKFGELLIFNQLLPHGNICNLEKETRWSINCRFKSLFSPYNEKKLGEYFEAITLRKVSELAIKFDPPKINVKS